MVARVAQAVAVVPGALGQMVRTARCCTKPVRMAVRVVPGVTAALVVAVAIR